MKLIPEVVALKLGSLKRAYIVDVLHGNPDVEQNVVIFKLEDTTGEFRAAIANDTCKAMIARLGKANNEALNQVFIDALANPFAVIASEQAQRAAWLQVKGWDTSQTEQVIGLKDVGYDLAKLISVEAPANALIEAGFDKAEVTTAVNAAKSSPANVKAVKAGAASIEI